MYTRMHAHMRAYTNTHTRAYPCPCAQEYWHRAHTHAHVHTHTYMHTHAHIYTQTHAYTQIYVYTGCPRRNVPDFGRMFLMLKYTDITQNTYIQS